MPNHSMQDRIAPLHLQPLRWLAYICVAGYHRVAYRVRFWGRLPRRRGPAIVVSNHQHEIESPVVVSDLALTSFAWRYPIFTVSSRRMYEPGFFAERVPWLTIFRTVNLGWLFAALGMRPIENELQQRPFASVAHALAGHGALDVNDVFTEKALERFPPDVRTASDILAARHFGFARSYVRMNELRDPYKSRIMQQTRSDIESDIAHFEDLARDGATIFLTPEGFYSGDGRMQRLRGILSRLQPLATTWLAALSYDPYDAPRLTMLYRVLPAVDGIPLDVQLKARRPVTASALVCTYLAQHPHAADTAVLASVREQLAALPAHAFIVPELRDRTEETVRRVMTNLRRTGTHHPQFEAKVDMIAYQRNFHEETLEGLIALQGGSDDTRGDIGTA
jgi:hypothetical protein